jgi:hypothetical protein
VLGFGDEDEERGWIVSMGGQPWVWCGVVARSLAMLGKAVTMSLVRKC